MKNVLAPYLLIYFGLMCNTLAQLDSHNSRYVENWATTFCIMAIAGLASITLFVAELENK